MKKVFVLILFIGFIAGCGSSKKGLDDGYQAPSEADFQKLIEAAASDSSNADTRLHVAEAYIHRGQPDSALAWYDRALAVRPDYLPAVLGKADVAWQRNDTKEAYALFLKSLMLDKSNRVVPKIAHRIGHPYHITQITHGEYDDAAPSFSPDGKLLAYQSNRDGNMEIYMLELATNYETRLTTHPARDEFPVFSRNGKIIAFTSTRDDTTEGREWPAREIYLMDTEAQRLARLTHNDADDWYPHFSPKENLLLYASTRGDIRDIQFHKQWSDIYLHDIKKKQVARLTESKNHIGTPAFAPDGKRLAYNMLVDDYYQIFTMEKSGGSITQVTFDSCNHAAPQFSPDNRYLVYFADRRGNCDIFMLDLKTSQTIQLTNSPDEEAFPKFSPDGKKIVFHARTDGHYHLFWIDLEQPITREELVSQIEGKMEHMATK